MAKTWQDYGREWLDTFVVSISVAMAFRCYYYQPFNIPTGSMQPTLYGNHTVVEKDYSNIRTAEAAWATASVWDRNAVLGKIKWLVTGKRFIVAQAPASGTLMAANGNNGYYYLYSSTMPQSMVEVPADALQPVASRLGFQWYSRRDMAGGDRLVGGPVSAGQLLWVGTACTGDFLFVNRWIWHFRKPRRGDVMVFATNGIDGIQQGTHYIKRMVGLPNEEISIKSPKLFVNGEAVDTPLRIGQIARQEKFADFAYPYAGFRTTSDPRYAGIRGVLIDETDKVKLGADEYYACGDNSPSSLDSRYWGPVPGCKLTGKAALVFWPITSPRWGFIE